MARFPKGFVRFFSWKKKMAFIQNGVGKRFLGHQVKFSDFQAATSCEPVGFLLTLPK